jgi:hypothetical protein
MALSIGGLDLDSILEVPAEIASTVESAVTHALSGNASSPVSQPAGVSQTVTAVVPVGSFKANVEHGLSVAIQVINVTLSVGFFLPANVKNDLTGLRSALQKVYGWLG